MKEKYEYEDERKDVLQERRERERREREEIKKDDERRGKERETGGRKSKKGRK